MTDQTNVSAPSPHTFARRQLIVGCVLGLCGLLMCGSPTGVTAAAGQATLTGRVIITKVMTKKRVTMPSYEMRGVTVNSENPDKSAGGDTSVNELSRVVIYLEGPGLKPSAPVQGTLAQKNRRFEPDIVVVPVGSSVSFPNHDLIFHNVFSLSKVKQFDLGYYPSGETRTVKFDRPGVVQVYCHIHPDMNAAIVVLPTGLWTRPSPDGGYSISAISPGAYTLVVWHRSAGFFRRHITVSEGATLAEDVVIPIKDVAPGTEPKAGSTQ